MYRAQSHRVLHGDDNEEVTWRTHATKFQTTSHVATQDQTDNHTNFYKLNFRTYFKNLDMGQMQEKVTERKYKEMTIKELKKEAKKLKKEEAAQSVKPADSIQELKTS